MRKALILFAVFNPGSSGIYRVSAAGGEPIQVTKAETGAHRLPTFLPDGRRFLYMATGERDNGVQLASLESGVQPRRLTPDVSGARYVPPSGVNTNGHVLFVRDQTLMAQPVDPKSLESTGDLFPITAYAVGRGQNPGDFSYSVSDQGTLIYGSGGTGSDQKLVWFDRGGKEAGSVGTPARFQAFEVSVDGKRVVSSRQRGDPSRTDLWVSESSNGVESRITFDDSRNTFPVWSPDGGTVVFASNRMAGLLNLYSRASNGTGQDELVFNSKEVKIPTDWSRDGKFLIFRQTDAKTSDNLWALPMTGEKKPILIVNGPGADNQGRLSPDGKWLAYTSNESNRLEVYVQPFGPAFDEPVTGKWQISRAGGAQPRWREDGKELFFMAPDRKLMAVDIRTTATTFESGTPHTLFESPADLPPTNPNSFGYSSSPDGKRFLILTRPGGAVEQSPLTVVVNWLAGIR